MAILVTGQVKWNTLTTRTLKLFLCAFSSFFIPRPSWQWNSGGRIGANGRQLVSTTGAVRQTIANPSHVDEAQLPRTPEQILTA